MTTFRTFTPVAPIPDDVVARFSGQVPDGVVDLWRSQGAGFVGTDGFFRVVDPARAASMLDGVLGLPDGATVLFTTALGDVIAHVKGIYLVVRPRWGAIDVVEDASFDDLVASIEDPALRESAWEWEPYPAARDRDGVPGFEQCFGFVPLLALGGPPRAENLQRSGLYEHLALIAHLAGPPEVRRVLELPARGPDLGRLEAVGRALFDKLTAAPALTVFTLPDGLGVCLVHAVRGGGTIFVAPDETVLFTGSAVTPDAALTAFRDGTRTPLEKFDVNRG